MIAVFALCVAVKSGVSYGCASTHERNTGDFQRKSNPLRPCFLTSGANYSRGDAAMSAASISVNAVLMVSVVHIPLARFVNRLRGMETCRIATSSKLCRRCLLSV